MEFGIVTDELSEDPREAIETALEWGITRFEIRSVLGVRFPRFIDDTLDLLVSLSAEYDIQYTAVSPGFFKCSIKDTDHIEYALGKGLDIAMDFMEGCDIPTLICFGFEQGTGTEHDAIHHLKELADRLEERNLCGAVENEVDTMFDTPAHVAELLRRAGRPNLGANWDYANLKQYAPEGFPEGYERVKRHIVNVHAKDVALSEKGAAKWVPIGEGVCDWQGQISALAQDNLVEHITIEPHCPRADKVGLQNLQTLQRYLREKR